MRPPPSFPTPTTLLWAVALACGACASARAEPALTDSSRRVRPAHEALDRDPLSLGRAVMEQSVSHPRGVVEQLEPIDFSLQPSWAEADRAAFLLGHAYLQLGSTDRFVSLARNVARWERKSAYTEWLAFQLLLIEAEGGDSLPAGPGAADAPLAGHLPPLAAAHGGDDATDSAALAAIDTSTAIGRDLAGAARIRLATRALERGDDARALLDGVPAGSRYASRAHHMLGLIALERGETERGMGLLASLLAGDSSYAERREAWLALADRTLEQGRWDAAHQSYEAIDRDWTLNRDALERVLAERAFDSMWAAWRADPQNSGAVMIDAAPARALAENLASESADLRARPATPTPALDVPRRAAPPRWPVPPPAPGAWKAVAAGERRAGEAADALERNRSAMEHELETLGDRRRYFGIGRERNALEAAQLVERTTRLAALRAQLDSIDAKLRAVRDEATRRVAMRAARILETCAGDAIWIGGMRRLNVDGPDRARAIATPDGYPGPDSVLAREDSLAAGIRGAVQAMAADAPGRIARSYAEAWRPKLIDRAIALNADAARGLAMTRVLGSSVDSSIAAAWTDETVRRLDARMLPLAERADSLRGAVATLRDGVARKAVDGALASLDGEREAIDYGLAASAYGLGVRLERSDSSSTLAAAAGASIARDTTGAAPEPGEEFDDPASSGARADAIVAIRAFLERHPRSLARGEMRFRLADLLMIDSRQAFRERMAGYVREQSEGGTAGAALPVMDHAPALALYREILAEDLDFPHRDAVLFDAGMILADDGDPEAARYFDRLVTDHPHSPYCQESYLRMGDMQFNEKRFAAGIELYQHAAAGTDLGMRVIALYKMGWAHFNEDRFMEAADAFRGVLDLYGSDRRAIPVDIEGESQAYLVHSLAAAGGAPTFEEYFGRIGARPYERTVLLALGQQFRRYGEFPRAAEIDELFIRRFPLDPDALVSAERLVETLRRSERPARERESRLALAPRFAPASEWFVAQRSDSVRDAGADFARSSWTRVALDAHLKARSGGSREDWQEALRLYDMLLAHWPKDANAPAIELNAGEASARLGDHAAALGHYAAAARGGPDSIASLAMWQRVAVTDAWYESMRAPGSAARAALGPDSLAHAVIDAGDALLARFPEHPQGANLVWRQSQIALAHGWYERAARDLERMSTRYPDDRRSATAACQRGDAFFHIGQYEAAGAAFESALAAARRAGRDSLARVAAQAIPVCAYRRAEAAVAEDSTRYERNAALFEQVAARWPEYTYAPLAEYRAGLAYLRAGQPTAAARAMQALVQKFPRSEYVRDAQLQLAKTWEANGAPEQAAQAYLDFAKAYPDDESARGAWLEAADLLATAGLSQRAEDLRLQYIAKYPDDVEGAMEILEALARRDLASASPERAISTLLDPPGAARRAAPAPSHLAAYLRLAGRHPELASRSVLAQVRYLQGEESRTACAAARLMQPLPQSLAAKQRMLDSSLVRYRRSIDLGVPEWAHASAFRIGETLVDFGESLERSQRPADLQGDDLRAYEDVLMEQSQTFYDRGEGVWTDLLRQRNPHDPDDTWIAQAQGSLWRRLSSRFYYRPEADFPLVSAKAPPREHETKAHHGRSKAVARGAAKSAPALAGAEGGAR